MKKLFTILAVAIGFILCGCTESEVDAPPQFEFAEGTNLTPEINPAGGRISFSFYSPSDWWVTTSDSWLSVSPEYGEAGDSSFTVSASANREDDSRTGTIKIRYDYQGVQESCELTVTQKKDDVLYINSQSEYYIGVAGGEIAVNITTNIDYTVSIPSSAQSWLKLVTTDTRALRNETLRFAVSRNDSYDTREAVVKLLDKNRNAVESFTVTQSCDDLFNSNPQKDYSIGFEGGNVGIVIETNMDYTVRIPSSAQSWIKLDNTRAYRQEQVNFVVSKNSGHDVRQAKIELVGKDNSVLLSFTITQLCQDMFEADTKSEYTVEARGGNISVDVATNIEYSVKIPTEAESWIKLSDTRAYRQEQVTFVVSENEGKERKAKIELLDSTGKALQSFAIKQLDGRKFDIDGKSEYSFESAGGVVEIDVQTNMEYSVVIPTDAQSWVKLAGTRALRNEKLTFTISANTEKVARSAQVTLKDTDNQPLATILFKQKALVVYDNSKESGLYLGIQGFNNNLAPFAIQRLSNKTIAGYNSFIDNLSMSDYGTLLYHAVNESITSLQMSAYPNDIYNVSIVTFTDGLDATSLGLGNNYVLDSEYISAIDARLKQETVSGIGIDSYTIGVLGEDAKGSEDLFNLNLNSLATSSEKVFNLNDMSEVNAAFYEIAKNLGETNTFYNVVLSPIAPPNDGAKVRFTFDNASNYDTSRKYIEGVGRRVNMEDGTQVITIEDIKYVGMSSTSGTIVKFVKKDSDSLLPEYELAFDNLQFTDGSPVVQDNIMYWWTKQDIWVKNSEFSPNRNIKLDKIQRTAAIMLNLDCSGSLKTSGFNALKTAAKTFVATLLEYATDPNEVASVSLDKTSVTLGVGNTTTLKATVLPTTASQKDVVWSSSNTQVASVNQSGVVTANAEGTATITVTTRDGGYTATCKVTVVKTLQSYTENASCGLNMKMVCVEGGTFTMGATSEQGSGAYDNEKPTHSVTLSSYYIAECEVTQAQWYKIMGTTLSEQKSKAGASSTYGVGDNYPMYYVSWTEAQDFCTKLSQKTGKTYVLPTEAQWEYAARGGNKSKGYKYSGSNTIGNVAWYTSNSSNTTHPVKQKTPNELGLYDMSGNVLEWCSDWSGSYSSSAQTNPTGPSSGIARVLRGGYWSSSAWGCRVSIRYGNAPSKLNCAYGFRVVCLP